MGFKPTSKMQLVAIIAVVLLIIGAAFLILKKVGVFDETEKTVEDYSSYDEFRKDVNNSTFIDKIPATASDLRYYNNQTETGYEEAVSFTVDNDGWFGIHSYYIDLFDDYKSSEKYIEEENMQVGFMDLEGLTFAKRLMVDGEGSFRVVRYARKGYSSATSRLGVLYNKDTGRVVIFESYD
ncbi:MAG: hypothetical protein J5929_04915 [Eubacterium sp.]|nr:hypothetical protein [Eubacterium sp.]